MSVCLWTLTGLLQLYPVIAVTTFVLSEVQPSQHLWMLPLEIHRQREFMAVNYGSSNYFIPMITGFHKKEGKKTPKNMERHRWSQTPSSENRPSLFTFYILLPRPLKSVNSPAQGTHRHRSQRVTSAATRLHFWAQRSSSRAGHGLSGQLGCWSYMLAFHVHFGGFWYSWHLHDPKAQKELNVL